MACSFGHERRQDEPDFYAQALKVAQRLPNSLAVIALDRRLKPSEPPEPPVACRW